MYDSCTVKTATINTSTISSTVQKDDVSQRKVGKV